MPLQLVETFQKGDAVPEWLIKQEPTGPNSKPGTMTFGADCSLYEDANTDYVLLPESLVTTTPGQALINFAYISHCRIAAASRNLHFLGLAQSFLMSGGQSIGPITTNDRD